MVAARARPGCTGGGVGEAVAAAPREPKPGYWWGTGAAAGIGGPGNCGALAGGRKCCGGAKAGDRGPGPMGLP